VDLGVCCEGFLGGPRDWTPRDPGVNLGKVELSFQGPYRANAGVYQGVFHFTMGTKGDTRGLEKFPGSTTVL